MRTIITFLSVVMVLMFAANVNAQTAKTVSEEHKDKKQTETQVQQLDKQTISKKMQNVKIIEQREVGAAKERQIDPEKLDAKITELETLIEKNKDNTSFNLEAHQKRLAYLKEQKAAAIAK